MKKFNILISILLLIMPGMSLTVNAQSGKVPPFQIIQPDKKLFRASDLPLGKPIIIVYFSPECEDCQEFTKELLGRMNDFKDVSIVMITFLSVESVTQFATDFKLNNYSNIYIGTEGASFFIRSYYNIATIPFLALYSKDGDLIKAYRGKIDLNDLSAFINAL